MIRPNLHCILVALYTFIIAQPLRSQGLTLSLDNAIGLAKGQSLDFKMAQYAYKSGFWNYSSFRASLFPAVSLVGTIPSYNRSIQRVTLPTGQDIFVPSNQAYSTLSLSLTQQVGLTGGTLSVYSSLSRIDLFGKSLSSHQYSTVPVSISYSQGMVGYNPIKWQKKAVPLIFEESQRSYYEARENICLSVVRLYFALLQAQDQVRLDEQNAISADTIVKVTKDRFYLGTRTKDDLLRAELDLLEQRKNISRDKVFLEQARQNFVQYLHLPAGDSVVLHAPEDVVFFPVSLTLAMEKASANRQKVVEFRRRRLEAEQNLASAKAAAAPVISVFGNLGYSQTDKQFLRSYSDLLAQQTVSLQVSIPIIDWGMNRARVRKARADLELAASSIEQEQMAFEQEISFQTMQWNMLEVQLSVAREARTIAMERFDLAKQHYNANTIGFTEYSIAQQQKDAAVNSYTDNLRNFWTGYYTLRRLTLFDFRTMTSLLKTDNDEFHP